MTKIDKELLQRSNASCELCGNTEQLAAYAVPPVSTPTIDTSIWACKVCTDQITIPETMDVNHWRCLNDSMWSPVPAVQVMAWRLLHRLKAEGWPQDLLDMMYLDEETASWAAATGEGKEDEDTIRHIDSNGATLQTGDSVVLIKDLNVKGANFTAKRGTAVRNISLVQDNAEQIEGRVNGQHIVILTKFVKKT
ncbi:PhnA domain-containing protein [Aquimarina hainanensis]|uniref:PhnA domain-containing protein n=1 Tax=Aquimarina hainanensis TaxID=1578017 RepID=A0ABW5N5K1_9FLAO|nr:alkylphosphonate utilization protein [Aquimarina sp. TRL1]QKX03921.1 PhnA protein [Aquimarina sp. TRL1]